MNLKKINKINEKLAGEYNLIPIFENDWVLHRQNCGETIVLNSNQNTEEELDKFVKEHRLYEYIDVVRNELLIINILCFVICLINIFFTHSKIISGIVFGMLLVLLSLLITIYIITERNVKTRKLILSEDIEIINKKINEELIKYCKVKNKTTARKKVSKKKNSTTTPRKKASTKGEEKKD